MKNYSILVGSLGLLVVSIGAYLTGEHNVRLMGIALITLGNFITYFSCKNK
jgi:hypothetical protein